MTSISYILSVIGGDYIVDTKMMIFQSLFMLIPSMLGGVVGAIGGVLKTQKSDKENTNTANKLLLKMQLRSLHKAICINGETCSIDDKDDATQLYEAYKALGGNGTGKSMYQDIMNTKVTE